MLRPGSLPTNVPSTWDVSHMRTTAHDADGSTDDLVVETVGLTKRFGERVAVGNVDLRIPRGVAFGYLGPNGAGKTTLIRMLLGLTPATSGSMRVLGFPGA